MSYQYLDELDGVPVSLTRRHFAGLAVAGLMAALGGAATISNVAARENEPGDDRGNGGHGADDPPGDDHSSGGNGADDPPGDDHGSGGNGADDPPGDDNGGQAGGGNDDGPGDDHGRRRRRRRRGRGRN